MNRLLGSFGCRAHLPLYVRSIGNSRPLPVALPPNLQLADEKVLKPERAPVVPPAQYAFPILNVPTSIPVRKFLEPNVLLKDVTRTPLERRIFEVAIRRDIVHNCVRYIRHKRRQPKKTKRVNEISGSKKKPRQQKGGGQSQVGNKRNSAWRGGQKAFGPVLRDYSIGMMRKERALGMMISLAAKFREGNLYVMDSLAISSHRTSDLATILKGHGLAEKTVLIVDMDYKVDRNLALASANIPDVLVLERRRSNVYEIVKKDVLVLSQAVFEDNQKRLIYQYTHNGKRRTRHAQEKILSECVDLMASRPSQEEEEQSGAQAQASA
jgi:large subunit ribosomal protein L4